MAPMTHTTLAPALSTVPARALLAVDGRRAPQDAPFTKAVRALFAVRAALGARDDVPLEGTYAQDGDPLRFDLCAPHGWHWTLAVPAPDGRTADAVTTAAGRFGAPVVLRAHQEQRVAQLVHRGPYDDEQPSLDALYAFVAEQGMRPAGPHTEVYLTDPGTTAPGELRTVLRVPVWTG